MSSQQRTTLPSKRDDDHGGIIDRLLVVSRVVWDHVVSPGWLDGPRDSRGHTKPDALERRHADLFRAAEAMFPIVGLVCRRALAYDPRWAAGVGSYEAIQTAASVPAPSCVAWIIDNRHVRGKIGNEIGELFPGGGVLLLQENVMQLRPSDCGVEAEEAEPGETK
ncbi:hypothetical protein Pelo_19353 [Pelomyxa schiedti]|nr:hypothetical protein Pelo_19353 [Pelomyxa schiedti]